MNKWTKNLEPLGSKTREVTTPTMAIVCIVMAATLCVGIGLRSRNRSDAADAEPLELSQPAGYTVPVAVRPERCIMGEERWVNPGDVPAGLIPVEILSDPARSTWGGCIPMWGPIP